VFFRWDKVMYLIDPAPHPTEPDTMLLPLFRQRYNDYALYVTGTTARYYTDVELPGVIRSQLAMIHARQTCPTRPDDPTGGGGLATLIARKEMDLDLPIGTWMFPSWYLLVLENKVVRELVSPTQTV
jgi:hypothetical protein